MGNFKVKAASNCSIAECNEMIRLCELEINNIKDSLPKIQSSEETLEDISAYFAEIDTGAGAGAGFRYITDHMLKQYSAWDKACNAEKEVQTLKSEYEKRKKHLEELAKQEGEIGSDFTKNLEKQLKSINTTK